MKLQLLTKELNYKLIVVSLFCLIKYVCGRRFAAPGYYSQDYYDRQPNYEKIKTALSKLEHAPKWVNGWPNPAIKMGQVSGVALDNSGQLLVFHRATNKWDETTFTDRNVYQDIGKPAIPYPTVLVFNDTGELVDKWGQNLFHIPHGITLDGKGNVFVTDVALHQVFKFNAGNWQQPVLVLGEKFVPGNDETHFCKPSAVAVLSSGDFFIADGYCNHRILKMAPNGDIILQWGRRSGDSPFMFNVPHALALAEDRGQVCVADRERGRVACFRADNGTFVNSYSSWLLGGRLFSVAYSSAEGGRLFVVNGPTRAVPVRGYVLSFPAGRLLATFAPDGGFANPHDVVVSPDGSKVYVAELDPYRVYKFWSPVAVTSSPVTTARAKPTATIELSSSPVPPAWEWWWGAAGGAGGAAGAALVALAALALLRARNTGRKSITRRRWEYGQGEFKLRRLLERRRFTRVHSDDSDEEPAPMLPHTPANA